MSTVVVLGAGGMLGHKVCQRLEGHRRVGIVRKSGSHYGRYREVFDGVDLIAETDVLDQAGFAATLRELEPAFVVNCVGIVKQLEEAQDPSLSIAVNSLLPHRLATLCQELGARLIHISTDCVFDGEKGLYSETDLADARDLYGRSKALGETLAQETSAVTLRTSFIGRELSRPTHGLVEWFLAQDGGSVNGYAKVVYSGLTSLELADVIRTIVDEGPELCGVFQVASDPISKLDLLKLIRSVYELNIEIEEVDEPVNDRSLIAEKFSNVTGYRAPSWEEMIRRMRDDATPYAGWLSRERRSK